MADSKSNIQSRISSIKRAASYKKHRIFAAAASVLLSVLLGVFFLTGQITTKSGDLETQAFIGNWIGGDFRGNSVIFTFLEDGTIGYETIHNDTNQALSFLKGSYTVDSENGILNGLYDHRGETLLNESLHFLTSYPYSFSTDKNNLFLTDHLSNSWNLTKTRYPSLLQLSLGVWEGFLNDGSYVSAVFGFDMITVIRIEKNGALTSFFAGGLEMYEGWARLELTQDFEAWEVYNEGTKLNDYLFKRFTETGEWESLPTIVPLPPLTLTIRQDIVISADGNTLLLPNFWAGNGEVLELFRK